MNQGGTVRKRKRRVIAKVNGLTAIPYKEAEDIFDVKTGVNWLKASVVVTTTHSDTRIQMTNLIKQLSSQQENGRRTSRPSSRVTRDPSFHALEDSLPSLGINSFEDTLPPNYASGFEPDKQTIFERPYFLDKTTMIRLKQILTLAICSGTVPWYFNWKEHRIDKWPQGFERIWKIVWFFITLQTLALTIFQFYSFISGIEAESGDYRSIFMNSVSVYWYVCAVYFNINMYLYKDEIREYINTLFQCNKYFMDKYVLTLEDYEDGGRVVINLSIPSNTSQVFASVALFLVIPYQPWYLFSYIYPKPWYWLIPGAIQEFVVVGQVISNYILFQWILVSHCNSVEFWLKEIHNGNESGFTHPSLRTPQNSIDAYRSLQVLCCCFNSCMAPLAIPMLKTHILTGLVPCGYVFIRSMNHKFIEEFPGILTYPICCIDCGFAGFVILSLAAEVYDLASGFVMSWSLTKSKDFRRILISCPSLKIWVGRFYYMTVSTTITFFKVTWDYIIDCIIAFPQNV